MVESARRRALWPGGLALATLFVVLRAPSLLEPAWYSDEGTYADIGRSLLHGARLYGDVWDNKPPGMYWLMAAIVSVAGPRAPAVRAVLAAIVALGVLAVWMLGRRFGGTVAATAGALVAVVLLSVPNLEGNLLNAEIVGGVLVAWAVVLVAIEPRPSASRWCLAGALAGMAVLCKAVFLLDVIVIAAAPAWIARAAGRRWRTALRDAALVGAGTGLAIGAAIVALAWHGSVGGLVDVVVHQDTRYVQLTSGAGGVLSPSSSTSPLLVALRLAVPLMVAGWVAWRQAGRGRAWVAVAVWWLGCDLAGAMTSARGFPHYTLQAGVSLAVCVGLAAEALWRRDTVGRLATVAVIGASLPVLQLAAFVPGAEVALATGRALPPFETGSFRLSQVPTYYRLSWDRVTGSVRPARYERLFPADLVRLRATVGVLKSDSRPGDRVFVWGTVHWAYALSGRLPAGRFVSLNTAYAVDPAAERVLLGDLRRHPPAVLIGLVPIPSALQTMLARVGYRLVPPAVPGGDVWLAPWTPARLGP